MTIWATLPVDRILAAMEGDDMSTRFTDPPPVARLFDRRVEWEARRDAAFNRAVVNQTLLACALRNLLTAIQVGDAAMLREAEEEGVRALCAVGGPPQETDEETSA